MTVQFMLMNVVDQQYEVEFMVGDIECRSSSVAISALHESLDDYA